MAALLALWRRSGGSREMKNISGTAAAGVRDMCGASGRKSHKAKKAAAHLGGAS